MFKKSIALAAVMAFAMTSAAGAEGHDKRGHDMIHNRVTLSAHIHVIPDCTLWKTRDSDFRFRDLEATDRYVGRTFAPSVTLNYVCSLDTNPKLALHDFWADHGNPLDNPRNAFYLGNNGSSLSSTAWIPFTINDDALSFPFDNQTSSAGSGALSLLAGSSGSIVLTAKLTAANFPPPYAPGHYSDVVYATLFFH
jgi:hypothetical protein